MTYDLILANAQLILAEEVISGSICITDGQITRIDQGTGVPQGALDMEGDFIAPGLIELHTDNLERHLTPRPTVNWPHNAAIIAHDRELAGTGITTVYDAIRVGSIVSDAGKRYGKYARRMADEILAMRDAGALKISHHIHLRAEICSETLIEELDEFDAADRVGIVSMMDHTPGQRQFRDISKFKESPSWKSCKRSLVQGMRLQPSRPPPGWVRRWPAMMTPPKVRSAQAMPTAFGWRNFQPRWRPHRPAGTVASPPSWARQIWCGAALTPAMSRPRPWRRWGFWTSCRQTTCQRAC